MTWLSQIQRGDSVMIFTPNLPPRKRKVTAADDCVIKAGGMSFDRRTGTTAGDRYSLGPLPTRIIEQEITSERVYLATRVRNASTHELTIDQLRQIVSVLDE